MKFLRVEERFPEHRLCRYPWKTIPRGVVLQDFPSPSSTYLTWATGGIPLQDRSNPHRLSLFQGCVSLLSSHTTLPFTSEGVTSSRWFYASYEIVSRSYVAFSGRKNSPAGARQSSPKPGVPAERLQYRENLFQRNSLLPALWCEESYFFVASHLISSEHKASLKDHLCTEDLVSITFKF